MKVSVTIEGDEYIEFLPIMDYKNQSIALENVLSTDVNKSIQRALTKACARHGLGLSLYGAEDLGLQDRQQKEKPSQAPAPIMAQPVQPVQPQPVQPQPVQPVQMQPQQPIQMQPQPVKQQTAQKKPTEAGYKKACAVKFTFGQHDGETLGSVMAVDRQYVEYIADEIKFAAKTADANKIQQAAKYMLTYLQQQNTGVA